MDRYIVYNALNSTIKGANMNVITANTLKLKGVTILEEVLRDEPEARISIRGAPRFVVMTQGQYDYFRDCELSAAIAESKEDIAAGRVQTLTADEYIKTLRADLKKVET